MGNHEHCEFCGENDFHRHRPCDPEKVKQRQCEQQQREIQHAERVARMKAALDTAGVKYTIDAYGYATVSPYNY
jgi:hypothetical protein